MTKRTRSLRKAFLLFPVITLLLQASFGSSTVFARSAENAQSFALQSEFPAGSSSAVKKSAENPIIPRDDFIDDTAVCRFKNVQSGLVLDVYGEVYFSQELANVQVYSPGPRQNLSQQFIISPTDAGWVQLLPLSDLSQAVNPYSNAPSAGCDVNIYPADPYDRTQGWLFHREGNGWVICSAYDAGLVLTADGVLNKSNVYLDKYELGNRSQLWEIERIGSENMTRGMAQLYAGLIAERESEWGTPFLKASANLPSCLSLCGLCWCQLLDMDGDGVDELILITNQSAPYQDYVLEIWSCDGGHLWQMYQEGLMTGSEAGSEALVFTFLNGQYCLMTGYSSLDEHIVVLEKEGSSLQPVIEWEYDDLSGKYLVNGEPVDDPSSLSVFWDNTAVYAWFTTVPENGSIQDRSIAQVKQTKDLIRRRSGFPDPQTDLSAVLTGYSSVLDSQKTRWDEPAFALAYLDEDDCPELLVAGNGSILSTAVDIYTWKNGAATLIGQAGGFGMIDFIPKQNAMHFSYQRLSYDYELFFRIMGGLVYTVSATMLDQDDANNCMIDSVSPVDAGMVTDYRTSMGRVYGAFSRFYWGSAIPVNEDTILLIRQNPEACTIY